MTNDASLPHASGPDPRLQAAGQGLKDRSDLDAITDELAKASR